MYLVFPLYFFILVYIIKLVFHIIQFYSILFYLFLFLFLFSYFIFTFQINQLVDRRSGNQTNHIITSSIGPYVQWRIPVPLKHCI